MRFNLHPRRARSFVLAAIAFLLGAIVGPVDAQMTQLTRVANGLFRPTFATAPANDPDRLFVTEVTGKIKIVDLATKSVLATPFLDITDTKRIGEGGLLGLAFHPDYANNGKFYASLTVDNGGEIVSGFTSPFSTVIREYTVSADENIANPVGRDILKFARPENTHAAGWIGFNPAATPGQEDYLYIASGDGGVPAQAETTNNLFGSILRIDPSGSDDFPSDPDRNYAIPASNPFVGTSSRPEVWSHGLRNPWRNSFDTQTGDLWIGDVGSGRWEEVNHQTADSTGAENYGWPHLEGNNPIGSGTPTPGNTRPVYEFAHFDVDSPLPDDLDGDAVVGGYVYRGPDADDYGKYFFGDTVSGRSWKFDPDDPYGTVTPLRDVLQADVGSEAFLVSFGTDANENLYWLDFAGEVFRFEPNRILGDYNGDGAIGSLDYQRWQADFGSDTALSADGNGDGLVDAADYTVWRDAFAKWGSLYPEVAPTSVVPEPASAGLLALAALSWCHPLRRRHHG